MENNPPSSFSQEEWSSHANHIFQRISRAYHSITAPYQKHRATQIEKEIDKGCSSLPSIGSNRSTALDALQRLAVKWREQIQEKQKMCLHFSLVRHRRIKKNNSGQTKTPTRDRLTFWETSEHESVASEPAKLVNSSTEAMANLGGDPNFRPCPDLVRSVTRHLPSCPTEITSLPLPEITDEWLQNKLNRGPSTKATGEDCLNYYVLKLDGSSYLSWLCSCMHAILKNTAPPESSHALLALLFK